MVQINLSATSFMLTYWVSAYCVLTYWVLTYWVLTYWVLTYWVLTYWVLTYLVPTYWMSAASLPFPAGPQQDAWLGGKSCDRNPSSNPEAPERIFSWRFRGRASFDTASSP